MKLGQQEYTSWAEMGIHGIPLHMTGKVAVLCPFCSHTRKREHRNDKCMTIHLEERWYRCHNAGQCERHGFLADPNARKYTKPEPIYPTGTVANPISEQVLAEWMRRGISHETLKYFGVVSSPKFPTTTCIPFRFNGDLYNYKYRWLKEIDTDDGKKTKKACAFTKDARLIMYNLDSIAIKGKPAPKGKIPYCIFTEGEPDAWSWHQVGKTYVVSVPNGATKGDNPNMDWFDDAVDFFENIPLFYIASDNDEAGRNLRTHLALRLGPENCRYIGYPEGCKDSNDVLKHELYGEKTLLECFDYAPWHPIKGVSSWEEAVRVMDDVYENGRKPYAKLGWRFDEKLTWKIGGALTAVSGKPGSGKSDFAFNVAIRLAWQYGVKSGFYSMETGDHPDVGQRLIEILTGRLLDPPGTPMNHWPIPQPERPIYEFAKQFVKEHFFVITEKECPDMTVFDFIKLGEKLVRQHGIKFLWGDPYNKFKEAFGSKGEIMSNALSDRLTACKTFCSVYDVHMVLFPHPVKLGATEKMESIYDANGGAAWANKIDYAVITNRDTSSGTEENRKKGIGDFVEWKNDKCKQRFAGSLGEMKMAYHYATGVFGDTDDIGSTFFQNYLHWPYYKGKRPYMSSLGKEEWAEFNADETQPLTPTIVQPRKDTSYFDKAILPTMEISSIDDDEKAPF